MKTRSHSTGQRTIAAAIAGFASVYLTVPVAFANATLEARTAASMDAGLALAFPPTSKDVLGTIPEVPDPARDADLEQALGAGTEADRFFVHHAPDPVNAKNANLFLPLVDIAIPGPGFDLRIARAYNSRSNRVSAFGYGWSFNYDVHVEKGAHGELKVVDADGFVSTFARSARKGSAAVRARVSRDIVAGMKQEHEAKGQSFDDNFYARIYEKLLADDAYYDDTYGTYATGLTPEDGVYWSTDRGVQKLVSAPAGYVRTLSDGSGQAFDTEGRLSKVLDKNGNFLKLDYDGEGRLQFVADRAGRSLKFAVNPQGRIEEVRDPVGRTLKYQYDAAGNLTASTDLAGQVTRFEYDAYHNLTKITYPGGASTVTRYDVNRDWVLSQAGPGPKRTVYEYGEDPKAPESRMWTSITDSLGAKTVYEYDDAANTVTRIDPLGARTTTYYSPAHGKPVKEVDALGRAVDYAYDKNGDLVSVTDTAGRETKITYEPRHGRVATRVGPDGSKLSISYDKRGNPLRVESNGRVRAFAYDEAGNVTAVTEADGATTRIRYDDAGNPIRIVEPEGATWSMKYDRVSRLQALADPRGGVTRYTFDPANRITQVIDAAGRTSVMVYDDAGHRIATVDPRGATTRYAYNSLGQMTAMTRADGSKIRWTYDANGNVRKAVQPNGGSFSWEYDKAGRMVAAVDPVKGRVKYTFDRGGRLTNVVRANGGKVSYEYDDADRIVKASDPAGGVATLTYDVRGRLTSVTNQLGAVSKIQYDAAGRVKRTIDATGKSQTFGYDARGRRTSHVDAEGHVTTYGWDKNGRLISVRDGLADRRWVYDGMGNMLGYAETVGGKTRSVAMTYDAVGRMVSMKGPNGGLISRTYDETNHLASVTDPDGKRTTFLYDELGRLTEMTDPALSSTKIEYDALGNVAKIVEPGGAVTRHEYDKAGRRIATHEGNNTLRYAYDAEGNTTAITGVGGKRTTLGYDSRGLLASLTPSRGKKATYKYDAAAELVSAPVAGGKRVALGYDAAGRLTSFGGRSTSSGSPAGAVSSGATASGGDAFLTPSSHRNQGGILPGASSAAPGSGASAGRISSPGRRSPLDGASLGPVSTDASGNVTAPGGTGNGSGSSGNAAGGSLGDLLGGVTVTPNADGTFNVGLPVGDGGSVFLTVGPNGVEGGGLNYSFPLPGGTSGTLGIGYDATHGLTFGAGVTLPGGLGSVDLSYAMDGTVTLGGTVNIPLGNGGSLTLSPSISYGPDGLTWDGLAELDIPGVGTFAVGFADGEFNFADYSFGVPLPGGGILNVNGRAVNGVDGFEVAGLGSMTLGGGLGNMDFVYGFLDGDPYFVSRGNLALPMDGGGFVDIPLDIDFGPGGLSLGRNGALNIPLGNGLMLTSNGTLENGFPALGINDFCITCFLFEII